MKRKINLWFIFGTLLIIAALILSSYNILDETRAEDDSKEVLTELVTEVKEKQKIYRIIRFLLKWKCQL